MGRLYDLFRPFDRDELRNGGFGSDQASANHFWCAKTGAYALLVLAAVLPSCDGGMSPQPESEILPSRIERVVQISTPCMAAQSNGLARALDYSGIVQCGSASFEANTSE